MQNDTGSQVVVIAPDETGKPVANVIEVANPNEPESVVEEIIDAIFDPFGSDEELELNEAPVAVLEPVVLVEPVFVTPEIDGDWTNPDIGLDPDFSDSPSSTSEDDVVTAEPDYAQTSEPADTGSQAHVDAATELQSQADDAIEHGDYAAAAELRESAENEAWIGGSSEMLHGADSARLESAADQQERAAEFEREEGQHAAAGDYEAARHDASNAADAVGSSDFNAGGSDHTAQADAEYEQMDWAVADEHTAEQDAQTAEGFAEAGMLDSAEVYAESAIDHQESADYHGDLGEHDCDLDTSVDTSSSYDDTSSSVDS